MTRHDPGIDTAALTEEAAKKAEALAEARAAALSGDWTPARQLADGAQASAQRTERDTLAQRIRGGRRRAGARAAGPGSGGATSGPSPSTRRATRHPGANGWPVTTSWPNSLCFRLRKALASPARARWTATSPGPPR